MKQQFSRKLNRSGASLWAYGIAVLFVVALITVRVFAPDFFTAAATPFWDLGTSLSANVGTTFAAFENKEILVHQNLSLVTQVNTLTNENEVLAARAQDLTKLLGGPSVTTSVTNEVPAGVLAAPPESPYDTLTIAAGTSDGIANGAFVYSAGGIPIGTIAHLTQNSSQVSLFSTPGRSTSGWVGIDRIPVTLTGMGAGAFTAAVSPGASASTTVSVGDTVYVPGPGALPIGTVVQVKTDPSSPTPTIQIQPLVDLFSITWVEVARSS